MQLVHHLHLQLEPGPEQTPAPRTPCSLGQTGSRAAVQNPSAPQPEREVLPRAGPTQPPARAPRGQLPASPPPPVMSRPEPRGRGPMAGKGTWPPPGGARAESGRRHQRLRAGPISALGHRAGQGEAEGQGPWLQGQPAQTSGNGGGGSRGPADTPSAPHGQGRPVQGWTDRLQGLAHVETRAWPHAAGGRLVPSQHCPVHQCTAQLQAWEPVRSHPPPGLGTSQQLTRVPCRACGQVASKAGLRQPQAGA